MTGKTLTHDQVLIIRSTNAPPKQLARIFKVSADHITRIQRGIRRTHVPPSVIDRFHNKYVRDPETGCWDWKGKPGRAMFSVEQKTITAARYSYSHFKGKIPDGKFVCHHCDNMRCVNPDHLFVGTSTDNNRDMHAKGRGIRGSNHHWSKLTEMDVKEIREMRKRGITLREIGERFGVTIQGVHHAISGKSWGWLQ